jgi:hypothetical protein
MASRAQAMAAARRFGMILDESVTGKIGECGCVTFDHPTHSFGGDCRSITVSGYQSMSDLWGEAIDRINEEGPGLVPCDNPACEYHGDGNA